MKSSMSNEDLKQAILRLTDLIANQQQQIAALQEGNPNQVGSEKIIESLSTGIDEFRYDPDSGIFFDSLYARYEDVFKEDGMQLDDKAKVRLLLRKIGTQFHERYVNRVLPSHPRDFDFEDTVEKLKKLFGCQKSLFNARYQCLQYVTTATIFPRTLRRLTSTVKRSRSKSCPATNSRRSGSYAVSSHRAIRTSVPSSSESWKLNKTRRPSTVPP